MGVPLANEWAKLMKSFVENYYGKTFACRLFIKRVIFIVRKCYSVVLPLHSPIIPDHILMLEKVAQGFVDHCHAQCGQREKQDWYIDNPFVCQHEAFVKANQS